MTSDERSFKYARPLVALHCVMFLMLALMVRLAGIEPTTLGFGGQYSIH